MRWPGFILVAVVLSGCIGIGGCRISFPPLAVEQQVGPMLIDPDGGPPIECRGLEVDRCDFWFEALDDPRDELDPAVVSRIVVSCVGVCTAAGGEMRVDSVLADGSGTGLLANGGYGEFEQSCS